MTPKVTVIMPVYNGEKYLREAIESILNQTFKDYEFLIIVDPSTDNTIKIIKLYNDSRIRLIENKERQGLVNSLNIGLELAQGGYIARMDADDISLPQRLQKQVDFMDKNPEIGVCGTWLKVFGDADWRQRFPVKPEKIKCNLFFRCSLGHPTIIMRKNVIDLNNLRYDSGFKHAEDYEFWTRISNFTKIANIPEYLLLYRFHNAQVSKEQSNIQDNCVKKIHENLLNNFDIQYEENELDLHHMLCSNKFENNKSFAKNTVLWLEKIKDANSTKKIYPEPCFSRFAVALWFKSSKRLGLWSWRTFIKSKLAKDMNLLEKIFYLFKCINYEFKNKDLGFGLHK